MHLEFVTHHTHAGVEYRATQRAEFPPRDAEKLIARGVAKPLRKRKETDTPVTPASTED